MVSFITAHHLISPVVSSLGFKPRPRVSFIFVKKLRVCGCKELKETRTRSGFGFLDSEAELALERELLVFMKNSKNPNEFPTKKQLLDAGRVDLVNAITKTGGWLALGWDYSQDENSNGLDDVRELQTRVEGFQHRYNVYEYGPSSTPSQHSARSLEMFAKEDAGVEGILSRLEKHWSLSFDIDMEKNMHGTYASRNDNGGFTDFNMSTDVDSQIDSQLQERQRHDNKALTISNPIQRTTHHRHLLHLLNQCTSMSQLKQIHAHTLRTTSTSHPHTLFLYSRILHFSSLHELHYALLFFRTHIENPNSFAWNTVIRACARSTCRKQEAILLYLQMLCQGSVTPDKHSFPFVLKACAYLFALSEGKQLHAHIIKLGLASDVYINNSLIHLYGSCGSLEDARDVFVEMCERSVVSWNVMIDTLVQLNEHDDALMCFREMQQESVKADSFAIQSILRACAGLGALSLGMWAHAYVLRRCNPQVADDDVLVNNNLLDMYCKCGSLETAKFIFERMAKRDVTSWNTMIHGFAMHGQAMAALEYLRRMVDEQGLMPNSITFSGVLSACRHSGMVNEGRNYFTTMTTHYRIEPVLEHYGCLVDLLARAGLIVEALDVVSNMAIKPDVVIWRSILDACSKRSMGMEVSEEMAKKMMESEEGSGGYMLLSRVYAVARKWDEVGAVRKLMMDNGVAKEPGCSTIEIDGVANEFFAGDSNMEFLKLL